MRLLVTGGAGFIGSHLCERLIQNGHQVVCLDNFDPYYDPHIKRNNIQSLNSHPHFKLIEGNILNRRLLKNIFSEDTFDSVVHLAARAGVRPSIQKPLLRFMANRRRCPSQKMILWIILSHPMQPQKKHANW